MVTHSFGLKQPHVTQIFRAKPVVR